MVTTVAELEAALADERRQGRSIGLVPTMGALHAGHRSLMARASAENDVVSISIFVNPLQFNEAADFEHYPRELDSDLAIARATGVDIVFAPSVAVLYPDGDPIVRVDPGPMGDGLEGASRPGHFSGVATVVTKLFALFAPDRAYFGEKDFEQLTLIRRLVRDLCFQLEVVGCATVRANDGVALSSRNERLSFAERAVAPILYQALRSGATAIAAGEPADLARERMHEVVAKEPIVGLEYAEVRDAATMRPPGAFATELRLLIAARIGPVRLIDNLAAMPLRG